MVPLGSYSCFENGASAFEAAKYIASLIFPQDKEAHNLHAATGDAIILVYRSPQFVGCKSTSMWFLIIWGAFLSFGLAYQTSLPSLCHQVVPTCSGVVELNCRAASARTASLARALELHATGGREAAENDSNEEDKKERLMSAYRAGQYLTGATAALLLVMPDRTKTALLASKVGGAAGYGLAAGLCYILQRATNHNRLGSDTYKRLNIGLLGFSAVSLTAIPGEAAFLPTAALAMVLTAGMTAVRLYLAKVAFTGWKRGVNSASSLVEEFVQGCKDTFQGLKVQNAKKALTYRNCLLLVLMGMMSSVMEGLFLIRYLEEFKRSLFEVSLQWSALARLGMISTMIYSLKDAAERDRLSGTTFIELNLMIGFWALAVALGQGVTPLGYAAQRGVEMFAFSLPFFIKAFKSQKEKAEKESS